MKMKQQTIFLSVIVLLVLGSVLTFVIKDSGPKVPNKYDVFATCLKDEGAVFYGAFWCSHCKSQKELFGSSAKLLPYVECSTSSGENQTDECKEKGIKGYPTWIFKDGSIVEGGMELSALSEKTSCILPE